MFPQLPGKLPYCVILQCRWPDSAILDSNWLGSGQAELLPDYCRFRWWIRFHVLSPHKPTQRTRYVVGWLYCCTRLTARDLYTRYSTHRWQIIRYWWCVVFASLVGKHARNLGLVSTSWEKCVLMTRSLRIARGQTCTHHRVYVYQSVGTKCVLVTQVEDQQWINMYGSQGVCASLGMICPMMCIGWIMTCAVGCVCTNGDGCWCSFPERRPQERSPGGHDPLVSCSSPLHCLLVSNQAWRYFVLGLDWV